MFKRVLVANRGEIACRVIRTLKRLGIHSIAIASDTDMGALHTRIADECHNLGANEAKDSYLSIDKIIAIAKHSRAEAIHPGYGFLSENAEFARAVKAAGIKFIGPAAEAIELMGDKVRAKEFASKYKMPLVPGISVDLSDNESIKSSLTKIKKFGDKVGFPLIIKAAAGGGGRGMRKVNKAEELAELLDSASREAKSFFKDGRVFVEKMLVKARHIEVQAFGDQHNNAIHLFTRDCTMQRRHQKVIEEAPAAKLNAQQTIIFDEMQQLSIHLLKAAKYEGAGTVEFLLTDDGEFYFLEVNSRLQVEHPVTEEITGVDLVELQLKIAQGLNLERFLIDLNLPEAPGHALELRLLAESPEENFISCSGQIELLDFGKLPPQARVESGYKSGDSVPHFYDSLIAKLVIHRSSRALAIRDLLAWLERIKVTGIKTNLGYLIRLLNSSEYQAFSHDINLAESLLPSSAEQKVIDSRIAGLALLYEILHDNTNYPCWSLSKISSYTQGSFLINNRKVQIRVEALGRDKYRLTSDGVTELIDSASIDPGSEKSLSYLFQGQQLHFTLVRGKTALWAKSEHGIFEVTKYSPTLKSKSSATEGSTQELVAPFPGKVIAIKCKSGDAVASGASLLVLESMKMEHAIKCLHAGTVKELKCKVGDSVQAKQILAVIN